MYRKGVTLIEVMFVMTIPLVAMIFIMNVFAVASEVQYYDSFKEYNHSIIKAIQELDQDNPHHDVSLYTTDVLKKSGIITDSINSHFHFLGTQKDGPNHLLLKYAFVSNKEHDVKDVEAKLASRINDEIKEYPVHNLKFVEHITVDGKRETILSYRINDKEVE